MPTSSGPATSGPTAPRGPVTGRPYLPPQLSGRRVLQILRARHWLVWGCAVLLAGSAFGVSLLMPKRYTATADVLLDIRESDPVEGHLQTPALLSAGYVATQADIVASDRVTRKVVRALGLDTNPAAIQQWHDEGEGGTVEQYYMDALRKALEVKPSRLSNVLTVRFSSPSSSYAATVANAFAKAYVDTNVELKADPARDFKLWFDVRTAQARERLELAQARLSKFQQDKGIVIPDEHTIDTETARLNELNSQLTFVQGQQAESQSRRDEAAGQMGNSPDVLQNPLIQTLRADVARDEAKLEELGRELGSNHPKYKSSVAELASLKEKLEAEIQRVATSVGGTNSVNLQKARQIQAALDAQKHRVLQLRALRDEAAVLRNDIDMAQHSYDLVMQRLAATNLESLVQQTNVTVLSEALPPVRPVSPRPLINTVLGAGAGVVLGVLLSLLMELRRPRLRHADDVIDFVRSPVLVTIPRLRQGGRLPAAAAGRSAAAAA